MPPRARARSVSRAPCAVLPSHAAKAHPSRRWRARHATGCSAPPSSPVRCCSPPTTRTTSSRPCCCSCCAGQGSLESPPCRKARRSPAACCCARCCTCRAARCTRGRAPSSCAGSRTTAIGTCTWIATTCAHGCCLRSRRAGPPPRRPSPAAPRTPLPRSACSMHWRPPTWRARRSARRSQRRRCGRCHPSGAAMRCGTGSRPPSSCRRPPRAWTRLPAPCSPRALMPSRWWRGPERACSVRRSCCCSAAPRRRSLRHLPRHGPPRRGTGATAAAACCPRRSAG